MTVQIVDASGAIVGAVSGTQIDRTLYLPTSGVYTWRVSGVPGARYQGSGTYTG